MKSKLKNFAFWIVILNFAFYILNFTGCATVPKQEALSTYQINGTTYFPLIAICDAKNINWQYDTFTRTVTLTKDSHRVNLRAADTLVLVDGRPWKSNYPIEINRGAILVPEKFKSEVLDKLFKQTYPARKTISPVLYIKKIVIDAGHGGSDPGAIGRSGLREKDVNLDIASRLANLLRAQGIEVVMTRTIDRFVPLSKRVNIANNSKADLFIAIHANANRVRSLSGFEVYYVASSVSDTKRAYASARDSKLNLSSSYFASNSLDLKATLWDMIYTYARAESIELSRSVIRAMNDNLDARVIGIKSARFEVLKGVQMPAALIEVGFLSNRNEELMLKNGFYRQKIAESIADGIREYAQGMSIFEVTRR